MKDLTPEERFEWLDAGRAIGDLSPEEESEWRSLSTTMGESFSDSVSFDSIVATLEEELSPGTEMPKELGDKVRHEAEAFSTESATDDVVVELSQTSPSMSHPIWGWAAAASLGVLLLYSLKEDPAADISSNLDGLVENVSSDPAVIRLKFADTKESPAGEILWSDAQQSGVMILKGLAVNDPLKEQYQLWIVDANRDDTHPVDGGVFDIPESEEESVIVPINAKLPVSGPGVFVITLEQPGGVVVSKQDRVIAIAKA